MRAKRLTLLSALVLSLSSCGSSPRVAQPEEYIRTLETGPGDFKVLQLADLHWNFSTDLEFQKEYLDTLIEATSPDLLMLTGDQFMGGSKAEVISLLEHLETYELPYAFAYGNHDFQGTYSIDWLNEKQMEYPHSLFNVVDDDVTGWSNYVINLTRNGVPFHQLYVLDSGSYIAYNPIDWDYEYIYDDQIEWFKEQAALARGANGGKYLPSTMYYHIPIEEFLFAAQEDNPLVSARGGYLLEDQHFPTKENLLFEESRQRGVLGMFVGHEHGNSFSAIYDGVLLGYGVKTSRELYFGKVEEGMSKTYPEKSFDLTGAALLTIHEDGTYDGRADLTHYYLQEGDLSLFSEVLLA